MSNTGIVRVTPRHSEIADGSLAPGMARAGVRLHQS
jgi:hypothetical protein